MAKSPPSAASNQSLGPARRPTISWVAAPAGTPNETGLGDSELAAHVHPALTTIRTEPAAWGRLTARTQIDLVHHGRRVATARIEPAERVGSSATTQAPRTPRESS